MVILFCGTVSGLHHHSCSCDLQCSSPQLLNQSLHIVERGSKVASYAASTLKLLPLMYSTVSSLNGLMVMYSEVKNFHLYSPRTVRVDLKNISEITDEEKQCLCQRQYCEKPLAHMELKITPNNTVLCILFLGITNSILALPLFDIYIKWLTFYCWSCVNQVLRCLIFTIVCVFPILYFISFK